MTREIFILLCTFFLILLLVFGNILYSFNYFPQYFSPPKDPKSRENDFNPTLYRPAFPENQPLSKYLNNGTLRKKRKRYRSSLFGRKNRNPRLFIARITGNDLWPLVSPCRSRINLARLIDIGTPSSIVTQFHTSDEWLENDRRLALDLLNTTIGSREENREPSVNLDILELWAPYRILNSTEHRMLLGLLGRARKRNLVFSVPVDFPSLALAKDYMSYLTNIALARLVVLTETVSFEAQLASQLVNCWLVS